MKRVFCIIIAICLYVAYPLWAQSVAMIRMLEKRYPGYSVTETISEGYLYYEVRAPFYLDPLSKGSYGLCDENGREIIEVIYDSIFEDGCFIRVKKNQKVGLFDHLGREILSVSYDDIRVYDGYFVVKQKGKTGIFNYAGQQLFEFIFTSLEWKDMVKYGKGRVSIGEKYGLADRTGKIIIPCQYRSIMIYEDYCYVRNDDGKVGIFDCDGKLLFDFLYEEVDWSDFKYWGYARVQDGSRKYGVADNQGNLIIPCAYDKINVYDLKKYRHAVVEQDGRQGIVNIRGEIVVPCGEYEKIDNHFHDNCVVVTSHGERKQGVLALPSGKEWISCQYDEVRSYKMGLFAVRREDKWGYCDTTGREIIPLQYDWVADFSDGVSSVIKDGVVSIIEHPMSGTLYAIGNASFFSDVDKDVPFTGVTQETVFAFLFANENYRTDKRNSQYSINDGKIFSEYCKKTLGLPDNNVRYYEDASYGNMLQAIAKMEEIDEVYEGEASIIFYFSGLGASDSKGSRYLLPTDASSSVLEESSIALSDLLLKAGKMRAEKVIVILDAPFSDKGKDGKSATSGRGVQLSGNSVVAPGRNTILWDASGSGECVYSSGEYCHSLFSYCFLKNLKESKGSCTIEEINNNLSWVSKETLHLFGASQKPTVVCPVNRLTINMTKL